MGAATAALLARRRAALLQAQRRAELGGEGDLSIGGGHYGHHYEVEEKETFFEQVTLTSECVGRSLIPSFPHVNFVHTNPQLMKSITCEIYYIAAVLFVSGVIVTRVIQRNNAGGGRNTRRRDDSGEDGGAGDNRALASGGNGWGLLDGMMDFIMRGEFK